MTCAFSASKLDFYLCADDANIYFPAQSLLQFKSVVNKELKTIKTWSDFNKLSINIEKPMSMLFKSSQHSASETLSTPIENFPAKQAGYVKFLGVLLDENLLWKYPIKELSKKPAISTLICLYNSLSHFFTIWNFSLGPYLRDLRQTMIFTTQPGFRGNLS